MPQISILRGLKRMLRGLEYTFRGLECTFQATQYRNPGHPVYLSTAVAVFFVRKTEKDAKYSYFTDNPFGVLIFFVLLWYCIKKRRERI